MEGVGTGGINPELNDLEVNPPSASNVEETVRDTQEELEYRSDPKLEQAILEIFNHRDNVPEIILKESIKRKIPIDEATNEEEITIQIDGAIQALLDKNKIEVNEEKQFSKAKSNEPGNGI